MNWYGGSIPEAVAEAKQNDKILLVYIEGQDDMSQQMTNTYNDSTVAEKLALENIIALNLSVSSVPYQQFCAFYPVLVIPCSYFIRGNGQPIEILTGSPSPSEFIEKINKVLEVCKAKSQVAGKASEDAATKNEAAIPDNSIPSDDTQRPSTSQTQTVAESAASIEEKVDRAKVLVEAQRQKKIMEEREKERKDEIERREMGKAIQQAEQTKKDNEMREWAKNRAKEKEDEKLAREKVKAMIAQDRADRAAKYQMTKEAEQAERESIARRKEDAEKAAKAAAMNSNEARIQFRLPDGSSSTHCFSSDSLLEEARRFVIEGMRPPFSRFSLCTTFPRRHFTDSNYSETFRDLQLAPSAVLLILPTQAVSSVVPSTGGFLSSIISMVLSPFTMVWNLIRSFIPWGSQEPSRPTPPRENTASRSPTPSTSGQAQVRHRQTAEGKKDSTFVKREGNVFRINNQSDDDENNTWNGNSTQQM